MIEFSQVLAARATIGDVIRQTPVLPSDELGERLGVRLWLKAELFQKTGSFKVRGALNRVRNTPKAELERGLITISAGNHALGLAWAAREQGAACTVVMRAAASPTKVAGTRAYGAVVVLHGDANQAWARLAEIQQERGLLLVHPFDDPLVVAGQGTVGLEVLEQVPHVQTIVCPIGGGGLISGLALAAKSLNAGIRIVGVEPVGASAMRQSLDRGEPVRLDSVGTIADGLAAPMAGELTFAMTRKYVDDVVTLTDDEIAAGMRWLMSADKLFVEPAGAAATAALLAGKIPLRAGETVVSIVSGGNLDLDRLKSIL
ncbi:MAG: threonine/serine dehydratase [Chloroflexi bacterium]|nr:threonine/serine dehydratase [Chloroflexota bacterium]